MGDGPRLHFSLFLGMALSQATVGAEKRGGREGEAHKRNTIVKPQQLAGSQTVNPKASFRMCTFKLTGLQLDWILLLPE